jgi:hypothetical protein
MQERTGTDGRVAGAADVVMKRKKAGGRVEIASGTAEECSIPTGSICDTGAVEMSANAPVAVLPLPLVLRKSAPVPVAVFSLPLFNTSVAAPPPVL